MIAAPTLAANSWPARDAAREDRLERAVAVLGGDDVARHERGDQREEPDRAEREQDERRGEARVAHVAAERDVVGSAALQGERDDEDRRRDRRGGEAEVGALLRDELAQLPAVDRQRARHHATRSSSGLGARRRRIDGILGEREEPLLERRVRRG